MSYSLGLALLLWERKTKPNRTRSPKAVATAKQRLNFLTAAERRQRSVRQAAVPAEGLLEHGDGLSSARTRCSLQPGSLASAPAVLRSLCHTKLTSLKGSNRRADNGPGGLSPSVFFLLSTFVNKLKMQQGGKLLAMLQTLLLSYVTTSCKKALGTAQKSSYAN